MTIKTIALDTEESKAILAKKKNQVRAVANLGIEAMRFEQAIQILNDYSWILWEYSDDKHIELTKRAYKPGDGIACVFGNPDSLIFLSEPAIFNRYGGLWSSVYDYAEAKVTYFADPKENHYLIVRGKEKDNFKPGVYSAKDLPVWACRHQVKMKALRLDRVQAISYADIIAEGCPEEFQDESGEAARVWYAKLWDKKHAKPVPVYRTQKTGRKVIDYYVSYPWDEDHSDISKAKKYRGKTWHVCGNPYVWVIDF